MGLVLHSLDSLFRLHHPITLIYIVEDETSRMKFVDKIQPEKVIGVESERWYDDEYGIWARSVLVHVRPDGFDYELVEWLLEEVGCPIKNLI